MTPPSPREELPLKLPDLVISPEDPWNDDVLGRRDLAARLTRLIQSQKAPFVISIDGSWGTGKTFLLHRWQKELKCQSFRAIYFNAWEDDFCDDPLLAILGQMSEDFKEGKLKEFASELFQVAGSLLKQNALSVLHKHIGLDLEIKNKEQDQKNLLQEYLDQRATKDRLKQHLEKMSAAVLEETEHPLVFIIDELDRCRPTFAIELLERVKHIFDVPNIVFVFGINRRELCSALQSVYGEIDATVYLRRFFDMEFILPEADAEGFCRHLMAKFKLAGFFAELGEEAESRVHSEEFSVLRDHLPELWGKLGLSLRDLDYCVRMIALVGRNLEPRYYMFPWLLSLLIPLKITNPGLFRQFIHGECRASAVMNHLDKTINPDELDKSISRTLDIIEVQLYRSEMEDSPDPNAPTAIGQLRLRANDSPSTHPEYLSERTQNSEVDRIKELYRLAGFEFMIRIQASSVRHIGELIDLFQPIVRR